MQLRGICFWTFAVKNMPDFAKRKATAERNFNRCFFISQIQPGRNDSNKEEPIFPR